MKKYAGFRNGYVRVRIYGEQTERFLNLCGKRGICIRNLKCQEEKRQRDRMSADQRFFQTRSNT